MDRRRFESRPQMRYAPGMTLAEFQSATNVSRETLTRMEAYAASLRQWQKAINLVAASSLPDLWRRHFLDSAQLFPLLPERPGLRLVDLGSGAGFPGLVLAILAAGAGRDLDTHLVESDARKAAFLIEAARAAGLAQGAVTVHAERAEALAARLGGSADVLTARALAPLDRLLDWAAPLLAQGGFCLLLKGAQAEDELTAAGKTWRMRVERRPSRTDATGVILKLEDLQRLAP